MRIYQALNDNCLQCCIAGILDLPLGAVPDLNLEGSEVEWYERLEVEMAEMGWEATAHLMSEPVEGLYILVTEGLTSASSHAVIARDLPAFPTPYTLHNPSDSFFGKISVPIGKITLKPISKTKESEDV